MMKYYFFCVMLFLDNTLNHGVYGKVWEWFKLEIPLLDGLAFRFCQWASLGWFDAADEVGK